MGDPALACVAAMMRDRTMEFYLETSDVVPLDLDRRG